MSDITGLDLGPATNPVPLPPNLADRAPGSTGGAACVNTIGNGMALKQGTHKAGSDALRSQSPLLRGALDLDRRLLAAGLPALFWKVKLQKATFSEVSIHPKR